VLQLRGRPCPGFALGAPGAFAQAQSDLQSQVSAVVVNAGDVYYQADVAAFVEDFSDAVASYQAAGQAGATSVGPEIDAGGASSTTSPLTQQAWTLNAQLAAISPSGSPDPANGVTSPYYTRADADSARALVVRMIALYQQAIDAGAAATGQQPPTPAGPVPSPSPPSSSSSSSSSSGGVSPWLWILPLGAVAGIGAAIVLSKPRGHHAPAYA